MHSTAHQTDVRTDGTWRAAFGRALVRHRLLATLVGLHAGAAVVLKQLLAPQLAGEGFAAMAISFAGMLPIMVYFGLGLRFWHMQRVARPANRAAWLKADLAAVVTDRDRLADTALALGLVVVFLAAFAQTKGLITAIQPFAWDPALAAADRALHFGLAPGAALQAVLGHPLVLTLVTGAYNFWLSLTMFVLFFACFARTDRLARMQFLLAFVLAWMLGGNVLATLFSSAGPVYVERLGLGSEFAPLMAALADHAAVAPVSVLPVQDWLWGLYVQPDGLKGISAFPSVHVATSVLMALYGFRLGRAAGWTLAGFATVIGLGSVLLAWHYAVDGYAGALVAVACWAVAGRLVRRAA
ncbi:MAG: phosphatase PAP2 family protein [Fuscovulum sp.]|nr:phosphatase PAP2 family protein [Fuscovulum sp.]